VCVCVCVCVLCVRVRVCMCGVRTAATLVAVLLTLVLFHTQRTLQVARLVPIGGSPVSESDVVGIGIRYVCLLGMGETDLET
jgi:hypothetical protein